MRLEQAREYMWPAAHPGSRAPSSPLDVGVQRNVDVQQTNAGNPTIRNRFKMHRSQGFAKRGIRRLVWFAWRMQGVLSGMHVETLEAADRAVR
jgi:hypothetical protein